MEKKRGLGTYGYILKRAMVNGRQWIAARDHSLIPRFIDGLGGREDY
ncbi:MAG: hypothetical protein LBT86_00635 [Deltaproteobacteria bacterium]|nr:hypothetical protein [Deltaproteobacteria bacterium]